MPLGDFITYCLPEVGIEAVSYRKDLQDVLFNASYSVDFARIANGDNIVFYVKGVLYV